MQHPDHDAIMQMAVQIRVAETIDVWDGSIRQSGNITAIGQEWIVQGLRLLAEGPRRQGEEPVTYASIDILQDDGTYATVVTHIVGDGTEAFNAIHNPPRVIVRSVRVT